MQTKYPRWRSIGRWLAVGLAGIAYAQGSNTLAQATNGCTSAIYRQFDFWIGDWEVWDSPSQRRVGSNRIEKILDGCALQENWRDGVMLPGSLGISLNFYSGDDQKWHQVYIDSAGKAALLLSGGWNAGQMRLEQDAWASNASNGSASNKGKERITWSLVDNNLNRVRQLGEHSDDGGLTWRISFDALYIRKP
jgi:hypothetical protein